MVTTKVRAPKPAAGMTPTITSITPSARTKVVVEPTAVAAYSTVNENNAQKALMEMIINKPDSFLSMEAESADLS